MTPNPDPLHVPEPDPPRRSGCLSVLSLALLLAIALGTQEGGDYLELRTATVIAQAAGLTPVTKDLATEVMSAASEPPPTPTGSVGSVLIGGWATFYSDPSQRIDHYAAAGPLLRDALGHWRGKVIRVTSGNRSTIVRLVDFCACGERHGLPTLLDLSPEAFRDLASLSAGIVRVEIELVALPATDSLPRNEADLRMMREVRGDELYREPVQ